MKQNLAPRFHNCHFSNLPRAHSSPSNVSCLWFLHALSLPLLVLQRRCLHGSSTLVSAFIQLLLPTRAESAQTCLQPLGTALFYVLPFSVWHFLFLSSLASMRATFHLSNNVMALHPTLHDICRYFNSSRIKVCFMALKPTMYYFSEEHIVIYKHASCCLNGSSYFLQVLFFLKLYIYKPLMSVLIRGHAHQYFRDVLLSINVSINSDSSRQRRPLLLI